MFPRSPDFLVIGAQKGGTSWLFEMLRLHPHIWMPPAKELHYFDQLIAANGARNNSYLNSLLSSQRRSEAMARIIRSAPADELSWWRTYLSGARDDDWYRSLFSFAPRHSLAGDITPRYALCDAADIRWIKAVVPAAKLLFIIRDPVERFASQCRMKIEDSTLSNNERGMLELFASPNGKPRGDYCSTILRYLCEFDPQSMLIIFYDAIAARPADVMDGVCDFLELPRHRWQDQDLARCVNVSRRRDPLPNKVQDYVSAAYDQELRTLDEIFGGYASGWRARTSRAPDRSVVPLATVRLTEQHLRRLVGFSTGMEVAP